MIALIHAYLMTLTQLMVVISLGLGVVIWLFDRGEK